MTIKLEAESRTIHGKNNYKLREKGIVPAVVFGQGEESKSIQVNYVQFEKIYKEAGENTIVDLMVDGKLVKVLISEVHYDPIKNRYVHVDLQKIKMDQEINANVELTFIGESKAVKEDGGSIVTSISEVEIRCLPGDLIHGIEVDVSVLESFDDVIKIKDLKIPSSVEIADHEPEDIVASVARIQEEKVEAPAPVEGETPAEGEASAEGATPEGEKKE
ncbi:MAG: 50S ribosomal protein L25 [Candidatus Buchananbacteria bacterium]